ncbi:MAG: proton-conducting transporter membrane subunit, partial [Alphaproteobacteria bacterium]
IGATFFLIGVGLIYAATGTQNIADMAQRIAPIGDSRTVRAALAFIVVGLLIKSAVFPLHFWLPNAYTYAPSVSTVFLAATATKVSIYVLVRMVFTLFGTELAFTNILVDKLLLVTAVAAMFVGSTVAIFQVNVKRMLAYSSVAQIGYMIVGIGMVSVLGVTGGLLHMFNHALIKGALFLSLGCVVYRTGSVSLDAMAGLGRRMPWTMGAFVVSGLGLIGVPLTAGFVSKWYLILAALERDWWVLAVLIVLSSLLAVIYIWRVVEVAYFRPAPADAPAGEAPLPMLVVTWVLTLASVYFGIHTDISVGVASDAAAFLLGAAR